LGDIQIARGWRLKQGGTDYNESGIMVDKAESAKRTIHAPDQCEQKYCRYTVSGRSVSF
jgi:hypothetical protein